LLNKRLDFESLFPFPEDAEMISHHTRLVFTVDRNNEVSVLMGNGTMNGVTSLPGLFPQLFQLNPDYLPDYQPSVAAAHKLLFAAIHLVANGNMVPQIVQLDNGHAMVRWVPAMIDEQVRTLMNRLEEILPDGLLQTVSRSRQSVKMRPIGNQTVELLSLFISTLVRAASKPSTGDLIEDLFFKGKSYDFSGVGEKGITGGIKVWLDRYHLTEETYKPVITVSETDTDEFEVTLHVENRELPDAFPLPLSTILNGGGVCTTTLQDSAKHLSAYALYPGTGHVH